MPGRVVDFGHDKKKRQPEKLPFVCELSFICYIYALNTLLGTF
jgi:hypothetical protein